jgi:hypothetical protein
MYEYIATLDDCPRNGLRTLVSRHNLCAGTECWSGRLISFVISGGCKGWSESNAANKLSLLSTEPQRVQVWSTCRDRDACDDF